MVSITILYAAAFNEEKQRLRELSQSQARLIESIARFDSKYSKNFPGPPHEATISQIIDAHRNYIGFGETGEFTLARRNGDQIEFILALRHYDLENPNPVPFESKIAEPMRRALSGQSGTVVGLDYRGEQVLAAYEPVAVLNLGIVAKIDLREIRQPFVRAGLWALAISSGFILIAVAVFLRVTRPISKRLIDMTAKANEANQAKSRFLAEMSHDLRTPLNSIMGFSDIMRSGMFGPMGSKHYDEYANDIYNSGALLVRLIDDVLDIAKVEAGKVELIEEVLDISELIKSCIHQLGPIVEMSKLSVSVQIPPDIPALKCDERVMFQLLNNLISNAIKFTPNDGKIDLGVELDSENRLVFCVTDNGIGMSEDDIEKALKPFGQIDGIYSRRNKGTGLGLPLCSNFMELFDGFLKIESAIEVGTTVYLIFPADRTIMTQLES